MNDIMITPARLDDVNTIHTYGRANWELWASKTTKFYDKKSLQKLFSDPRDDVFLVAREADKPIGWSLTFNLRTWAYCSDLFVLSPYRGKGIGKLLIQATFAALEKKNVWFFGLYANRKNKAGQEFYKKVGLRPGFDFVWMDMNLKKRKSV
ncbi:GNAT family N-acetyltransferase [Candidatus Gottesmanbacteria bacterium]|nr:GNAT family N-acetyltransferase [Candidatus Gottesmanbacteria bacterium]